MTVKIQKMEKKRSRKERSYLKSNKGMTIIFAMVIFAVAGIISMVIVNSAQANAGRLAREKQTEQDYLAATSVTAFIRDIIAGDSVTYTVSLNEASQEKYDTHPEMQDADYIQFAYTDSGYTNEFYSAIIKLMKRKVVMDDEDTVIPTSVEMNGFEEVYEVTHTAWGRVRITFNLASSYPDFTLDILVEKLNDEGESTYSVKIIYPAQVEHDEFLVYGGEKKVGTRAVEIYDQESGGMVSVEEDITEPVYYTKRTYNVSWVYDAERIYRTGG